ncbi:putative RNA-binding protein ARP1 [Hibiscus syriacus]|uniref:RNA-binding protein ARP1 n=1 Tax=Hibiscus syriacus TaxID=106335 RepID=A0A6A2WLN7_HIBSY|nr:putative RNA-binding protein ARP1 [Hibiscus syriacus]
MTRLLRKSFVGGLAWETQRDTMKRYFEQFGEIVEAVIITDKNTGRSKGYGFVTFKDPDAAMRACQNPSPTIDGRRANCNLASFGAQKTRPLTPQHGGGRFIPAPGLMASPVYHGSSSAFVQQPNGQYSIPYSAYGYTGYSQDGIYPLNYYSLHGGQQFSPYYATGTPGMFHNLYPFYAQHGQNSQAHGFCVQYPQMLQYPYLPHQYSSTGILSLPSSLPMAATTAATATETTTATTTTLPATSTTTPMSSSETEKTSPIIEPLTPATIVTTRVVEMETGPSQASETPTEKKPSS